MVHVKQINCQLGYWAKSLKGFNAPGARSMHLPECSRILRSAYSVESSVHSVHNQCEHGTTHLSRIVRAAPTDYEGCCI